MFTTFKNVFILINELLVLYIFTGKSTILTPRLRFNLSRFRQRRHFSHSALLRSQRLGAAVTFTSIMLMLQCFVGLHSELSWFNVFILA